MPLKIHAIGFLLLTFCGNTFSQNFINRAEDFGMTEGYGMLDLEEFGGGVSFYDFNDDGWDDLSFATAYGDSLFFYQNNQGIFEKITALAGDTTASKHLLWTDIDNDGDQDLFVTNYLAPNRLYENDGNMNLTDITQSAGFLPISDPTYGATFGDYDLDGYLDLYVTNRSNGVFDPYTNYLYKNNGDNTFTNVTLLTYTSDNLKVSFCASFLDINKNGRPDIYIANDRIAANTMFRNDGNGVFSDISFSSGTDIVINAMNVGVGDFDNDTDLDIYVTNTEDGNALLTNNDDETFGEMAEWCNITFEQVSWGGNFFDYDNDGDLDLYVSSEETGVDKSNALYENIGNGVFHEPLMSGITGDTLRSFGNAIGDFNNDGQLDIIVSNAKGDPMLLWENQTSNSNHWLKVDLEGTLSNRDGIGSWIEVYAGDEQQVRYTHCGIAYLAQNTKVEHFGLGDFASIDSLIVRWPSGMIDRWQNISSNQTLYLQEGITTSLKDIITEQNYFEVMPNPIMSSFFILKNRHKALSNVNLSLVNIDGEVLLLEKSGLIIGENEVALPSDLGSGIYFLVIKNEDIFWRERLIILGK